MSEKPEIPASKIYYEKVTEKMDSKEEITFSVQSQTDDGAKNLFDYVKSQFKEKDE